MFIWQIVFALIVAAVLTLLFALILRRTDKALLLLGVFLILFLGGWAAALWVKPFGPIIYDVYILPVLFIGVIFLLLLILLEPQRRPINIREEIQQEEKEVEVIKVFSIFFWLLLIVLLISILFAPTMTL